MTPCLVRHVAMTVSFVVYQPQWQWHLVLSN